MNTAIQHLPNQTAPVTLAQLREALEFMTEQYGKAQDATVDVFVWMWEAIQGDFKEDRSIGQVSFDTVISMIPGIDQVCDVRDLIANCKQINDNKSNTWAWVGLALTLIGLFPSLGSLVKGVLKIFFLFVRRSGGNAVGKAVDAAMTWVITFLRRRDVQKYWKSMKWERVFFELAKLVRQVRNQVNVATLLQAFDRGITLMKNLLNKVAHIPRIGPRARALMDMVVNIRKLADNYLQQALKPLQDVLDTIIKRLELEDLAQRRGIVNVNNVHYRGGLPEVRAVTLMREAKPRPKWLSKGKLEYPPLKPSEDSIKDLVATYSRSGYPKLSDSQIASFAKGMRAVELEGPMRLYRVVGPGNMAAGSDWVSEEVFKKIMSSADPRAAWRKQLAVWPDWNPNGQFVVYDLKAGEKLKVWQGPASSQLKDQKLKMDDLHLEGGWEQIKFDAGLPHTGTASMQDDMKYLLVDRRTGITTPTKLTYAEYRALPAAEKSKYESIRSKIHNPRISGPFNTGWGTTDFDDQLQQTKLGLPALPGQLTEIKK